MSPAYAPSATSAPEFPVQLQPPEAGAWRRGNTGIEGVWSFQGRAAGPHLVVTSLIHGNEIAGAHALIGLISAKPALLRGRLSLVFANLAAFDRFDAENPTASRFVEEDMNRLWDPAQLDGGRVSVELTRARLLRPVIESADALLDLHSMLWPSDPLILCGPTAKGRALAEAMGEPDLVVADHGHASGRRLIDHPLFLDPGTARAAILVEAGQHWEPATVAAMRGCAGALIGALGLIAAPAAKKPRRQRFAEVTLAVTACSGGFSFSRAFRGGDVVPVRNTLIATDGAVEIRTPHDDCLLVMPSLRPSRGHTAVRLARFADGA